MPNAVAEIILGYDMPDDLGKDILQAIHSSIVTNIPIYKVQMNARGNLTKNGLNIKYGALSEDFQNQQ